MPSDLEIPQSSYRNIRRSAAADPATRRLALIAGALGGALVLIVGAWMMVGHHGGGVPLIMADPHPIRVKPVNPGGMQVVGANDDVMSSHPGDGSDKVAPAPETPHFNQLQAEIAAARQAEAAPASAPSVAPGGAPIAAPAATASPTSAPPVAQTRQPPVPAAPVSPASTPAPSSTPTAADRAGGAQVQLAALASAQSAQLEWQRLGKRLPGVLDGHQPAIQRAEVDGKTVYRLRTGGFASMASAAEFCARIRAKGAACSIASF